MSFLDKFAIPNNLISRVEVIERLLDDLYTNVAMSQANPSVGDGSTTYIEVLEDHAPSHYAAGSDPVPHDLLLGFVSNEHLDHSLISLIAGAGLTGGGTIEADRTIDVGAGTLITVAANTVGITTGANYQFIGTGAGIVAAWQNLSTLAGDGLDHAIGVLSVDVTDIIDTAYGLTEDSNNIRINIGTGMAFSSGLLYAYGLRQSAYGGNALVADAAGDLTAYGSLAFNVAELITTNAGNLTIAPDADLLLSPTGNKVSTTTGVRIQSDNYTSQITGWGISYAGGGDFRYLFADEMHVKSFIADLEQALAGGQIICKSVAILSRDFTVPVFSGVVTLYVWDLPSAAEMAVFEAGDLVRLRAFSRAGGSLTIADCWGVVTNYTNLIDKEQSWTFTRGGAGYGGNLGSGTVLPTDILVLDYGTEGNGYYEVNAIDGVYAENSPYSQIVTWSGHPITGSVVRTRLGNLFGITATTEYGLYAGNGVTAASQYLRLTDVNFELHNLALRMYDNNNVQRIGMNPKATSVQALMWAGLSSTDPRFIVYGDGTTWLSTLAISEQMGDMLFSQADGLLLLGPGCAITPTSWTSTRGQVATISGAFHQEQGPWANSKALLVEAAATNLETNPVIRNWDSTRPTGWTLVNSPTCTQSSIYVLYDLYSCKIENPSTDANRGIYKDYTGLAPGSSVTASVCVYNTGGSARIIAYDGGAWTGGVMAVTDVAGLTRLSITKTVPAGGSVRIVLAAYTAGMTTYFDGIQVENTAYATTFVWGGAGTGYTWNGDGTPHANTSTRAATVVNLDAHAPMLNGLNTVTHSIWVQAQYAATGTWPQAGYNYVFDARGADDNNRYILAFDAANDRWMVYINGGERFSSAAQTFAAGAWVHLLVTLDFTADLYRLYINGVLAGSSTASFTAPTAVVNWKIGTDRSGNYYGGFAFGEYAVFGRVLTAEEVAGLYAQGRPLVDMGAFKRPGIYIMDGEFSLRSSQTGARVQIDVAGVGGYSAATTKTFSLETDGDLFLGSNISAPATTAFSVFANAQTYNYEALGAGDILLGDNSAGKVNVFWDVSEGDISIRRGITTRIWLDGSADTVLIGLTGASQCNALLTSSTFELRQGTTTKIKLDGSASTLLIGQVAANQNNILITSGALQLRTNAVVNAELTAAGELILGDDGGAQDWISISSANGIRMYGNNTLLGQWTTGGNVIIGEVAANKDNILISAGAISIRHNVTERIGMTAAGVLTIKDSSGNAVITLDAAAGAEITRKLTMPGANSSIAIGDPPPTSASVGTGIWLDRTGLYGLLSDVVQVDISSTTGALEAADGTVVLDADGISIFNSGSDDNYLRIFNDSLDVTYANHQAGMKLQVDAGYPEGVLFFGVYWNANISTQIATSQYNIDFWMQKAGSWREPLHLNFDYVAINSVPLTLGNLASAPTVGISNGSVYYNTTTHKMQLRANGAWTDLN